MNMDVAHLHRLSRILREIALHAAAQDEDEKLSPSQIAIIEDIARHPKTTAQQIVQRIGIAQSQVSTIIAIFKQRKLLTATAAPEDGRKQLIEITPEFQKTILKTRGKQPITKALAELHPTLTQTQRHRSEQLLGELSHIFEDR